jgi:hypothetical protein
VRPTISGFMHPSDPTRRKLPSFESAYEIVLTDAKFITKQQYSGDIWPLKVKRNCIVDKSLSKFILFSYLKMQYVFSLITFVSLVFSFSAVYEWIRLTFIFILIEF